MKIAGTAGTVDGTLIFGGSAREPSKVLLITCSYQGIANTFVQLRRLLVFDLIAAIPAAMFGMMRLDQGERG